MDRLASGRRTAARSMQSLARSVGQSHLATTSTRLVALSSFIPLLEEASCFNSYKQYHFGGLQGASNNALTIKERAMEVMGLSSAWMFIGQILLDVALGLIQR
eukprot:1477314-Amphidinium_carterae.3